jgi:hypothetical protein
MSTTKPTTRNLTSPYLKVRFKGRNLRSAVPVLRILDEHGPLPQTHVAHELSVTLASANMHFKRLEKERLVESVGRKLPNGSGRPAVVWDIEKQSNFSIGICLQTPLLLMGLADFSGRVVLDERHDLSDMTDQARLLDLIDAFVTKAKKHIHGIRGTIRWVYVGAPGHLDSKTGKILFAANMPFLNELDLEDHFRRMHNLPCMTHGAADAVWLGERKQLPAEPRPLV